jgi:hypothetical protein
MGGELKWSPAVTRVWWLVDAVSLMLESDERDAVRGDFAESNETAAHALRGILGLVVRRQAELWMEWRPWLALSGVAVPIGLILSFFIRGVTESSAIYTWMYTNWWTWSFLVIPGARIELAANVAWHVLTYVTLASWAWTCGFVLSALSRRTAWLNGSIFCLVGFGEFLAIPQYHVGGNSMVFSLTFYRVVFPVTLRTLLVVLPALLGMQTGRRRTTLPLFQTVLWAVAIIILTMRAAASLQGSVLAEIVNELVTGPYTPQQGYVLVSWDAWLRGMWPLHLLPFVVMWPVAYMVATASRRRWRSRAVAA